MEDIIKVLSKMEDFESLGGASQEEIEEAERDLDLKFASDYRKYLSAYGLASADGHEFTGIVKSPRLNVVDVTARFRKKYKDIPLNAYVIEELNIDCIVIFQTSDGAIYEAAPTTVAIKIASSFTDYLKTNMKDTC